ncbi:MAG: 4Fe-4S dicluster domain-containing protein [Ktedonobacterales bacterium]
MATRLTWVIEGLRGGIVTTPYPRRPDPTALAGVRTRPALVVERCQAAEGCDRCVTACLPNALAIEQVGGPDAVNGSGGAMVTLDLGRCIGCGLCVAACPHSALRMVTGAESATHVADDLRRVAGVAAFVSEGAER